MINIGDYNFSTNNLLGQGGFGHVYKGRHRYKNLDVAIKEVKKESFNATDEYIEREIKLLQELSSINHDNLVTLFYTCTRGRFVYIVMEYCNYHDLERYLRRKGPLNETDLKFFLQMLAQGLKILYEKNIVHRDLKPMNLLLHNSKNKFNPKPDELTLKIADFGISRTISNKILATTRLGTPVYMAPEIWFGEKYDHKADLWSIGIIIYECLFGKLPFSMNDNTPDSGFWEAIKRRRREPLILFPKKISNEMENFLKKLLQRDPAQRATMDEFLKHFLVEKLEVQIVEVQQPVQINGSVGVHVERPPFREAQQIARRNFFKKAFTLKYADDRSKLLEINGLNLLVNEERTSSDVILEKAHVAYIPSLVTHVNSKNSRTYGKFYPENDHFDTIKHLDIITLNTHLHEPMKKILSRTRANDRIHGINSGEKRSLRIKSQLVHFMDFGCGRFNGFAVSTNSISVIYNGHRLTEMEYNLAKNSFGQFDVAIFSIPIVKRKEVLIRVLPFVNTRSIGISEDYTAEKVAEFIKFSKIKWGFIFFERYKGKDSEKLEKEYESQLTKLAGIEIGSDKLYMVLPKGGSCTLTI